MFFHIPCIFFTFLHFANQGTIAPAFTSFGQCATIKQKMKEGLILRITIDTATNTIIVPNTYYDQIDKMNALLEANGGKKLDYTQYVKDEFEKSIAQPIKRQSDITKARK